MVACLTSTLAATLAMSTEAIASPGVWTEASAFPHPEPVQQKLSIPPLPSVFLINPTMRFLYVSTLALAGTVAAAAAIALGTSAAALPHRQAAETHAVPLASMTALSLACLGCAAGAVTDRRS
jgi:hypothetical protein